MKKNELKMRKLVAAIGLEFDEVRTILSEETLSIINMSNVKGGDIPPGGAKNYCGPCNEVQCGANCTCTSASASLSASI